MLETLCVLAETEVPDDAWDLFGGLVDASCGSDQASGDEARRSKAAAVKVSVLSSLVAGWLISGIDGMCCAAAGECTETDFPKGVYHDGHKRTEQRPSQDDSWQDICRAASCAIHGLLFHLMYT